MLSLNICIASVAIALFALSPTSVGASPSPRDAFSFGNRLVARELVAASEPAIVKREPRKAAVARVRLAKTRAARKSKRDAAVVSQNLEKRTTAFKASTTTTGFATYLATKCFRDSACAFAEIQAALPVGGAAVCVASTRTCGINCASGFLLQNDGSCLEGSASCPSLPNGAYFLVLGVCVASCSTSLGFTLTGTSVLDFACVNFNTNPRKCGTFLAPLICRPSYNGIGTASCRAGSCALDCPAGYYQYSTATGVLYCS